MWTVSVEDVCSRVQEGLPGVTRLRTFGHAASILSCRVESILHYGISAWFGNLTAQSQGPDHTTSMKIMGVHQQHSPQAIFQQTMIKNIYIYITSDSDF